MRRRGEFGTRYYDALVGRFGPRPVARRRSAPAATAADYEYGSGDPVNNYDLDGKLCVGRFRDTKCRARSAYARFGKMLKRTKAGYDLFKNANDCLNRSDPNVNASVSAFFNGLLRFNPFSGSPAYRILLGTLGKMWGCSTNVFCGVASELRREERVWVGEARPCPFFVPSR